MVNHRVKCMSIGFMKVGLQHVKVYMWLQKGYNTVNHRVTDSIPPAGRHWRQHPYTT